MKNKNLLKVFGITLLIVLILTWVIPGTIYDSTSEKLKLGTIAATGFADIFKSIVVVLQFFSLPAVLVLMIGMLYGVMNKTGLYKAFVDKILSIFKRESWLFVIITVLFYGVTTASTGIYLPMLIFIPLSIAILLELKYNKLQSLLLTAGSVIVGITAEFSSTEFTNVTGADVNTYLWVKTGLLVVLLALLALYVVFIKTARDKKPKDEDKSDESMFVPMKRDALKSKTPNWIPLLIVLAVLYAILVLGLKVWGDNGAFSDLYTKIKSVKIRSFAVFDSILGSFETFGAWSLTSVFSALAATIIAVSIIGRLKFKEMIDAAIEGAKKLIGPAFLTALIYLIIIFTLDSGFLLTIVNFIAKSGNIALVTLSSLIAAPFMSDQLYAAEYLLRALYIINTDKSISELYGLIVQVLYGFAMLAAPTSILLMTGLYYTGESYTKWIKYIWKLLLVILVACLIAITIAILI